MSAKYFPLTGLHVTIGGRKQSLDLRSFSVNFSIRTTSLLKKFSQENASWSYAAQLLCFFTNYIMFYSLFHYRSVLYSCAFRMLPVISVLSVILYILIRSFKRSQNFANNYMYNAANVNDKKYS